MSWIGDVAWAGLTAWALKTLPGWLMLMLAGVLAAAVAWRHRDESDYRFAPTRYVLDGVLALAILVLLGVGLGVLLGWMQVG